MICILAGNLQEARNWAYGQLLDKDEWFYPHDFKDLMERNGFHVIVIGSAGQNVPAAYFERLLHMAKSRGKVGRV